MHGHMILKKKKKLVEQKDIYTKLLHSMASFYLIKCKIVLKLLLII